MFSTPDKNGATFKKPPTPRKTRRKAEKKIERKTKKKFKFSEPWNKISICIYAFRGDKLGFIMQMDFR
jgi:hypothetical protein